VGTRALVGLVFALGCAHCTGGEACSDDFAYESTLPAGETGCAVTFSRGGASLVVQIADGAGCATAPEGELFPISCSSAQMPQGLSCSRGCLTGTEELIEIRAVDANAVAQARATLGVTSSHDDVGASLVCGGTPVDGATTSPTLEQCAL